ncbi:hypothetical protein M5689_022586 [Euphorbia peplus]|nr:hypothetical protein M5689_022586 [Euphorbia peplus]
MAKKDKKSNNSQLDILSRYQQKQMNLRRLLKSHPSMALGLGRDDSVEQSDDSWASPLLMKLKHKNWSNSLRTHIAHLHYQLVLVIGIVIIEIQAQLDLGMPPQLH